MLQTVEMLELLGVAVIRQCGGALRLGPGRPASLPVVCH